MAYFIDTGLGKWGITYRVEVTSRTSRRLYTVTRSCSRLDVRRTHGVQGCERDVRAHSATAAESEHRSDLNYRRSRDDCAFVCPFPLDQGPSRLPAGATDTEFEAALTAAPGEGEPGFEPKFAALVTSQVDFVKGSATPSAGSTPLCSSRRTARTSSQLQERKLTPTSITTLSGRPWRNRFARLRGKPSRAQSRHTQPDSRRGGLCFLSSQRKDHRDQADS